MNNWQITPYFYIYVFTALVSFTMAFITKKMRSVSGGKQFIYLTIFTGIWNLGFICGFFNTSLTIKLLALRLEYFGMVGTVLCWPLFVFHYTHMEHKLTKLIKLFIISVPVFTFIQVLFIKQHNFFYISYGVKAAYNLTTFSKEYGPGFFLWVVHSYLITFLSLLTLLANILQMPGKYPRQVIPIAGIILIILFANILYIGGNNPIAPYDPTPLAIMFSGPLVLWAMLKFNFLNIGPVAYNLVFQKVNSGVLVLDNNNYITDMNVIAEEYLECNRSEVVGENIFTEFSDKASWLVDIDLVNGVKTEIANPGKSRFFEMEIIPLAHISDNIFGKIIILYDITQRKHLEQRQEHLIDELQEAAVEIETLSGMLPICSSCKKIRDDSGYWQHVENFISKHSHAEFSHGICPDCMKKLYPNLLEDDKKK